jgi:hypothetical protein
MILSLLRKTSCSFLDGVYRMAAPLTVPYGRYPSSLIYGLFFLIARSVFAFGLPIPAFMTTVCWCLIHADGPVWNFPLCGFFFFGGAGLYYWILGFHRSRWMIIAPAALCAGYFGYLIVSGKSQTMRFYDVQPFFFVPIVLVIGLLIFSGGSGR